MKSSLLAMMMFSLGANVFAQDYVNNDLQFAISLPADQGWSPPVASGTQMPPQRLLLMATKPSGERISVQVLDLGDPYASLDEQEYREGFRNGFLKSLPVTMRLASEKRATLAGVPSYEMLFGGTIENAPMSIRIVAIVANRHQYNVGGYASDAASLTNGELARVLSSFRFTVPPQLPESRLTLRGIGEIAGRLSAYAAMAIVAVLLVRLLMKKPRQP